MDLFLPWANAVLMEQVDKALPVQWDKLVQKSPTSKSLALDLVNFMDSNVQWKHKALYETMSTIAGVKKYDENDLNSLDLKLRAESFLEMKLKGESFEMKWIESKKRRELRKSREALDEIEDIKIEQSAIYEELEPIREHKKKKKSRKEIESEKTEQSAIYENVAAIKERKKKRKTKKERERRNAEDDKIISRNEESQNGEVAVEVSSDARKERREKKKKKKSKKKKDERSDVNENVLNSNDIAAGIKDNESEEKDHHSEMSVHVKENERNEKKSRKLQTQRRASSDDDIPGNIAIIKEEDEEEEDVNNNNALTRSNTDLAADDDPNQINSRSSYRTVPVVDWDPSTEEFLV